MAEDVKFNVLVTTDNGEHRSRYLDAEEALGGSLDSFTAVLTSPNGLVTRRVGIDDNGALVLLPIDVAPVLTLGAMTTSSVALSWTDTTSTETAFSVERASDPDFTLNVIVPVLVGTGITTFVDTTVVSNTVYYYRVKAVVGGVDLTLPSNVVAAQTPASQLNPLLAVQRRNRSMYSKVALFAPMDEASGTSTLGQRHKRRYGAKDGIFNSLLRDDQPIDPLSSFYVGRLSGQLASFPTGVNFSSFALPFYEARWDTPKIHVSDTPAGSQMDLDDSPYKWGTGANTPWEPGYRSADAEFPWYDEPGGAYKDRSMLVIDTTNDELQEFFQVHRKGADRTNNPEDYPNVIAEFGGRMRNFSDFNGVWPSGPGGSTGFGIAATSISYGVLFIRLEELDAGVIPHAIPFGVAVGTTQHRLPATRGDQTGGTNDVPEGSRFRLPYDFDVAGFCDPRPNVTPFTRMIIQAAKDYGMVVTDASAGNITMAVQNLRPAPTYLSNSGPYDKHRTTQTLVDFAADGVTNTITAVAHGLHNSDRVYLSQMSGDPGFDFSHGWLVGSVAPDTFKLYSDAGLTVEADFTASVTGKFQFIVVSGNLMATNAFPWSSLQLLPPEAA